MNSLKVEILKQYSEKDAEELGILLKDLSPNFNGKPVEKKLLETIINSPDRAQLVARLEDPNFEPRIRIVGAASLNITMGIGAGVKGYLEDFVTDSNVQRQGVGSAIWEEMMIWFSEKDATYLNFTSHSSRVAAHKFYFSKGAETETTPFKVAVKRP